MAGFGPEGNRIMSYILDALKKLEHEKSRKSRGDGMINISGALFDNERPKPPGAAGRKIALAVTAAVLVTFTATWLFFQTGKVRVDTSTPLATPTPKAPPVKTEIAPATAVAPALPVQETPPAVPAQVTAVRPSGKPENTQKVVVPTSTSAEDAATALTIQELRKRQKERKGQAVSADMKIAPPSDITLSGIAWQEERRARRAVVNGFLMQEGGVISGARITDIFQDRVRFSLSGKSFEIPLISSGISAAVK
jgi:general secretion pathway protein B